MSLNSLSQSLDLILALAALAGVVVGIFGALRRQARQIGDMADALLGQQEVRDRSGAVVRDPQPGLAAQVKEMRDGLSVITQHELRISSLENTAVDHERRLVTQESASLERTVTRAEALQHLATVDAALRATPDPDATEETS